LTVENHEEADLALVDRHIEELSQRIIDLQERMATMAAQQYETRNQSLLLATMQEVMKDLHLLRAEMAGASGLEESGRQSCLLGR